MDQLTLKELWRQEPRDKKITVIVEYLTRERDDRQMETKNATQKKEEIKDAHLPGPK